MEIFTREVDPEPGDRKHEERPWTGKPDDDLVMPDAGPIHLHRGRGYDGGRGKDVIWTDPSPDTVDVLALPDVTGNVHVGKVEDVSRMERNGWTRLKHGVTMDSGSAVDITPEDENEEFPLQELTGPRRGKILCAANGSSIEVKGEKVLHVSTKKGQKLAWPFIAGNVTKTLKFVATTCDAGSNVLFTQYGAYVINLQSGEVLDLDRIGNNYNMEVWVRIGSSADPDAKAKVDFHRQGARR